MTLFALAGILAGTAAQNAWADNIDAIIVTPDSVVVTGTLSGCTEPRDIAPVLSTLDATYFIDLFAGPLPLDAEACNTAFTQTLPLPEGDEITQLAVSLYAGNPDEETPALADAETIVLQANSGDEQCQADCWLSYDLCLADCEGAVDIDLCRSECEASRAVCLSDCGTVDTTVLCTPETLNLASKGRWVTCKLFTEEGVALEDIDTASILLNGEISADRAVISDDGYLNIKFSRSALSNMFTTSVEPLTFPLTSELVVSGSMIDGRDFLATDTVRVIKPVAKKVKVQKKVKAQKKVKK